MKFCYKNTSIFAKTFYGVTFGPGEIKEVPGPIHHAKFIRLTEMPKPVVTTESKSTQPKKGKPGPKSKAKKSEEVVSSEETETSADIKEPEVPTDVEVTEASSDKPVDPEVDSVSDVLESSTTDEN